MTSFSTTPITVDLFSKSPSNDFRLSIPSSLHYFQNFHIRTKPIANPSYLQLSRGSADIAPSFIRKDVGIRSSNKQDDKWRLFLFTLLVKATFFTTIPPNGPPLYSPTKTFHFHGGRSEEGRERGSSGIS